MLKKTAELVGSRSILMSGTKLCAIKSPTEYYETLKKLVSTSSSNITMSALYLGCGKLEFDLIHEIEKALNDPKRPNLKVTVILDHSRALRGDVNSATLCSKIIEAHPERFSLFLYQVPQLRNVWSTYLPGQVREVLGVYHCKFNVFDNCAILTGANLSNDYFTDRQDRYLHISPDSTSSNSCSSSNSGDGVVKYLESFTAVLSPHCHRVTHSGGILAPAAPADSLAADLTRLNAPTSSSSNSSNSSSGSVMYPVIQHSMIGLHQERIALLSLIDATAQGSLLSASSGSSSSGPAHIRIATPYTSFKASLMQALLRANTAAAAASTAIGATAAARGAEVTIINPSAAAHGFAGASGVKSLVPKLHQCAFEQAIEDHSAENSSTSTSGGGGYGGSSSGLADLMRWLLSCLLSGINRYLRQTTSSTSSKSSVVLPTIYEFRRGHWSFHTKGMWFYPPEQSTAAVTAAPSISYIGSSNFGARSWTRDFELGFVLASEDEAVRQVMHTEYSNIEQWSSSSSSSEQAGAFKLTDSERVWLPAVTRLVKSFL